MDKQTRNNLICKARAQGNTYRDISRLFGISIERARQICMQEKKVKDDYESYGDMAALSVRVRNALFRSNISSKSDLIKGLENDDGIGVRGIWDKGIEEIEKYVGFKILKERIRRDENIGGYLFRHDVTVLRRSKDEA